MPIEWIYVSSSNIKAVGYDLSNSTLYIEFKSGGIYAYKDVEQEVYEQLLEAESIGSMFYKVIKGKYDCTKVEKEVANAEI